MGNPVGIGVLASGGGSNFEALARAAQEGRLGGAAVRLLISNKAGASALTRAEKLGVEALALDPKNFPSRSDFYRRAADEFKKRNVSLICLAGYLLKIEPNFLKQFSGRVLNIHPALLPKFGGAGMYGHHVHEAVLRAGERESGCSVHLVDDEFDHGPVLAQARVPVLPEDTPESLAARVLEQEHKLYPETVKKFLEGK